MMNAALRALPPRWCGKPAVLAAMGEAARLMLGTGPISLTSHTPNCQVFVGIPRLILRVLDGRATIRGVDMGAPAPLARQATLRTFASCSAASLRCLPR